MCLLSVELMRSYSSARWGEKPVEELQCRFKVFFVVCSCGWIHVLHVFRSFSWAVLLKER